MENIIGKLRGYGYLFACASCEHLQRSLTVWIDEVPKCTKRCRGPFGGGAYPERRSIIPIDRVCFVCGNDPDGMVDVKGKLVGICEKHIPLLDTVCPIGERPPFITHKHTPVL